MYSQIGLRPLFSLKKALSIIIKEVLLVTLRYRNSKLGNNWLFQQNNGTPHDHQATQEWRCQYFPSFIAKGTWPADSPDLNLLNYCIWKEFTQTINWTKVTRKSSLIWELKRSVKKKFICMLQGKVVLFGRIVCIAWHKTMKMI